MWRPPVKRQEFCPVLVRFLESAVEEKRYMRVLLCLGDTKLLQSVVRKILTECVADRLLLNAMSLLGIVSS